VRFKAGEVDMVKPVGNQHEMQQMVAGSGCPLAKALVGCRSHPCAR
jgi:hypothetical protein